LVGSSSISKSGRETIARHIATRRFSPPESDSMRRSPAGQFRCAIATSMRRSSVQPSSADDAMLQCSCRFESCGSDSNSAIKSENVLRAVADVFVDILRRIQHEILRQIADDQVAPPGHSPLSGACKAGENFQERRLAAAVAPDQTDAVAFLMPSVAPSSDRCVRCSARSVRWR
jgi:hypothetical protein